MSDYQSLPVYRGARIACDACGRKFNSGEVINRSKSMGKERIFCYGDSIIGSACQGSYVMQTGEIVLSNAYRFGNTLLPREEQLPNDSQYIVSPLVTGPEPTYKERVKAFFNSFFR